MRTANGLFFFGFFKGLPYGKNCSENLEEYKTFSNKLDRKQIIDHIAGLEPGLCPLCNPYDSFTEEELSMAGIYADGPFRFPIDFIRYLNRFEIGIPPEYEQYLIESIGLKP